MHAGRFFALGYAVIAERALLHHVLLVRRHVLAAYGVVHVVLRLFPVERAHARVGAGRHAHAAADALVVVLAHHTGLRVLVGGAHGAHLHARGVLAVLAGHGEIAVLQLVRIAAADHVPIHFAAVVAQDAVPPRIGRNVVFDFARHRAHVASYALLGVDDHTVASHYATSPSYLRTSTSVSSNEVF